MIAYLNGVVKSLEGDTVVIDVGGVGYEAHITPTAARQIAVGDKLELHIAEHIKEDHYSLFGFLTNLERATYGQLTSVSGVGPKAAMAVLAAHSSGEIDSAIIEGKIELFSTISGIGKKTAQRIILELQGKLVEAPTKASLADDAAYQALLSLGYQAAQARKMLAPIDINLPIDARVKAALQGKTK